MTAKRFFDVVVATTGVLLLAPLFAVVAILIRLDSAGPAIFRQTRVGRGFRPFQIMKFRTMAIQQGEGAKSLTVDGDARITKVGRWLRRAKLDELPQLLNVLLGDMSLVGPRPELPKYVDMFRDHYALVLRVRPGITDPASLKYRSESAILAQSPDPELEYRQRILPEKLRLSAEYAERSTFGSDLVLIFRTVFSARRREQA